jgi:hypothetical protein
MPAAHAQRPASYSALEQVVAAVLIVCLWGCATTPPPPKPGEVPRTTGTEAAVVGRLVLTRAGVDQTPYRTTADHALCFVPDGVSYEQARSGVRPATLETDGTFKALLAPGDYKLYSQHRLSQTQWIAVLPMAKLTVSSLRAGEIAYAGTLRMDIEQAFQPQAAKSWTREVKQVPIMLADESRGLALGPDARPIPALLQLQANIALAQPQHEVQACAARTLLPEEAKRQDANALAKGVLAGLLLVPLVAIVLVLALLSGGGGGSLKFPNM